jgi:hypothetical protein
MSNDFQALLSNFASATGGTTASSSNAAKKEPINSSKSSKDDKSLRELTTSLWQRSQLRQSMKSLKSTPSTAATSSDTATALSDEGKKPVHLAICLCVVDRVTHEHVWEEWIRSTGAPTISAELYVHAKTPERIVNSWTKSKLISISHRPNWNDVRIVQAMLSLMEEAVKDDKTTHIVFGTESCLPICPLAEVTVKHGTSYMPYYGKNQATRFDERDVWDVLRQYMPLDSIHKALPGWCTLSKEHAKEVLAMPARHLGGKDLWTAFDECWAPEEAFFPTALALLGLLDETERKSLTHAEWSSERTKRPEDKAHPKTWDDELDARLVASLRRDHGSVILRKIKYPIPVSRWRDIVFSTRSGGRAEGVRGGNATTAKPKRSRYESDHEGRGKKSRSDGDYNHRHSHGNH